MANNLLMASFLPPSFRIDFEQSYKSMTGEMKSSLGYLEYKFSGKIILKEFKNNTVFVSNNKTSWYYTPPFIKGEKGNVQINSNNNIVISKFFDSLKNGLVDNASYKVVKKSAQVYDIIFTDSFAKDLNLKQVSLELITQATSLSQVKKMDLVYLKDGKVVQLVIKGFDDKKTYSDEHFNFNIPDKTEIIKN